MVHIRLGQSKKALNKGQSISSKASGKAGAWIGVAFFSIFLCVGLAVGWFILIRPLIKINEARDWSETPCKIISSHVKSHSGSDSTTYSVEISYSYQYEGKKYTCNRYSFFTGSSSGYKGKKLIVNKYPAGSKRICFVDPVNPQFAVINRGIASVIWFGLIPFVFILVGAGGIIGLIRSGLNKKSKAIDSASKRHNHDWNDETESKVLKSKSSPVGKLIGVIFMAAFWNGIVSVFVWQAFSAFKKGHTDWFLTIFIIPFVVIGIGLIAGIFYQLMALFNPRVNLTVTPGSIRLGDTVDLEWRITGDVSRIRKMTIVLVGNEQATYRRGTNTCTDTEVFAEHTVLDSSDQHDMRRGDAELTVPENTMHTFEASNNKIIWVLRVNGDIEHWPDIKEEFVLEIRPKLVDEVNS